VSALVRAATAQPCTLPGLVVVAIHDFTPQTMLLRTCGAVETACFATKEHDHRQVQIQRVMAMAPTKLRVRAHGRAWVPRVVKIAGGGGGDGATAAAALQELCIAAAAASLPDSSPDVLEPLVPPPGRAPSVDGTWHTVYVLDCIPARGGLGVEVLLHGRDDYRCAAWVHQSGLHLQTGLASLRRTKGRDDGRGAVLVQSAWRPPSAVFYFTALLDDGEAFGDYVLEVYRLLLQARHTEVRLALVSLQGELRTCRTATETAAALQGFADRLRTGTLLATRDVDALGAAVKDLKTCSALLETVQSGRPPSQLSMTMTLCSIAGAEAVVSATATAAVTGAVAGAAGAEVGTVVAVPKDVYIAARTPFAAVTWLLRTPPKHFGTDLRSVALLRDTYGAAMMLDMFWGAWVAQLAATSGTFGTSGTSAASAVLAARSQSEHDSATGSGLGSNSLSNIPVSMMAVLAVLRGRHGLFVAAKPSKSKTPSGSTFTPVLTGPTANSRRSARHEVQALLEADLFAQNTRQLKACVTPSAPLSSQSVPIPVFRLAVEWVGV
jgi:hypothetical protein